MINLFDLYIILDNFRDNLLCFLLGVVVVEIGFRLSKYIINVKMISISSIVRLGTCIYRKRDLFSAPAVRQQHDSTLDILLPSVKLYGIRFGKMPLNHVKRNEVDRSI